MVPKPHVATIVYALALIIVVVFLYHLILGKK